MTFTNKNFEQQQELQQEFANELSTIGTKLGLSWAQVGTKLEPSWLQVKEILNFCQKPQAISDIMETVSWSNRTKFRNKYINLFLDLELIQMTIPDKPKSSKQKYQITQKGRLFFELLTDKK